MKQKSGRPKKHGSYSNPMYRKWTGIKKRCYDESNASYKYYGGRGIKVCDEWRNNFMAFYNWTIFNGYEKGLEIDRIDNDGDYTPENCRFVTHSENLKNRKTWKRKNSVRVWVNGVEYTLLELSKKIQVSYSALKRRYRVGERGKDLMRPPYKKRR